MDCRCSSCGEQLEKLVGKRIRLETDQSSEYTMACCCAHCGTILGCHVDPQAQQRYVTTAIEDALVRRGNL